jgi:hypothetical protein
VAYSPYTSQSWWMSAGFMFLAFKKRIQAAFHMWQDFRFSWTLQTHITMCKRSLIVCTWRLCLHKGPPHSARMRTIMTAAAIFANRTYFVDMPRVCVCVYICTGCSEHRLIGRSFYRRNFLRKSCATCWEKFYAAPCTEKSDKHVVAFFLASDRALS